MLIGALLLPLAIGAASLTFIEKGERTVGTVARQLARGYPLALALALVLVFLAVIGSIRKLQVLAARRSDVHVPLVVRPGGHDRLVDDLDRALDDAGLVVEGRPAPAIPAMPGRFLGWVAGSYVARLVPERLVMLVGADLEVRLYPTDVAIVGSAGAIARARAAIASRLTTTAAWQTTSEAAQAIERDSTPSSA